MKKSIIAFVSVLTLIFMLCGCQQETDVQRDTVNKQDEFPKTSDIFDEIGRADIFGEFYLDDEVAGYINEHPELFPTAEKEDIKDEDLKEFSYKKFNKTRAQDEIGLVKLDLYAAQVFEDDFNDGKLTSILAVDEEFNYYAIYYTDSVEVYDEDEFTVYALPCATSNFDNIGGGTTNVVVMIASYIEVY